eukprot:scaffold2660_cov84-Isochrysis_galbana.AAC.1
MHSSRYSFLAQQLTSYPPCPPSPICNSGRTASRGCSACLSAAGTTPSCRYSAPPTPTLLRRAARRAGGHVIIGADGIRKRWWIEGWSVCDNSAQAPAKQDEQFTHPIVPTPAKKKWAQSTTLASPPTRHLLVCPMQRGLSPSHIRSMFGRRQTVLCFLFGGSRHFQARGNHDSILGLGRAPLYFGLGTAKPAPLAPSRAA